MWIILVNFKGNLIFDTFNFRNFCSFCKGYKMFVKRRYKSRWMGRRYISILTNNKEIFSSNKYKSLGEVKVIIRSLNAECLVFIKENIWPLTNISLKKRVVFTVENILQEIIAYQSSLGNMQISLKFVELFCFSLVVRLYSIDRVKTRAFCNIYGIDEEIIITTYNFMKCFELLEKTHPKNLDFSEKMGVHYVEMLKKDFSKVIILRISSIVDHILQLQFLTLLDPIIDVSLHEHFYGFRKGRSALQAVGFLTNNIEKSDTSCYFLVSVNIVNCFDNLSHKLIINKFPFPQKYCKLLVRWIRCVKTGGLEKLRVKMTSGVPYGSFFGPVICNFILNYCLQNFFNNNNFVFPSNFVVLNFKNKLHGIQVTRFILGYADDIIIKVINYSESIYVLQKLNRVLNIGELRINEFKTFILDLSFKSRFEWLGYAYVIVCFEELKFSKFIFSKQKLNSLNLKIFQTVVLNYIADKNFLCVKKVLRETILLLKHFSLLPVLLKVNLILMTVFDYYSFGINRSRLNYLSYYVDRMFWRVLVKKFRYRGVRRTCWVANTFFITRGSPLGLNWHLHSRVRQEPAKVVWCVKVNISRLQSLRVNVLPKNLWLLSYYFGKGKFVKHKVRL